tara:strand:- start:776 stop:1231 length:456 start_codon:yes stop_codon:yes gene_type:complete
MPKYTGGCHCEAWDFETDREPMFLYQCNCESCRRLNGSLSIGACYREGEFRLEGGEEVRYDYKGGSGQMMFTSFCPECHVRLAVRPEILPELVFIPLGIFSDPNIFKRINLEIWTSTKLNVIHDQNCMDLSVADSGTAERIGAFLEALDTR